MCHLCSIKTLATSDRWPKPLESDKARIPFVNSAHDKYEAHAFQNRQNCGLPIPAGLLKNVHTLATIIDKLGEDLEKWWTTKRQMRERFAVKGEYVKFTELNKIHDTTKEQIGAMKAKLGMFLKWSLGMDGGVEELQEAVKKVEAEEARKAREEQKAEKARLAEVARKAEEARDAGEMRKIKEAKMAENAKKNHKTRRHEGRIRQIRSKLLSKVESEIESKRAADAAVEAESAALLKKAPETLKTTETEDAPKAEQTKQTEEVIEKLRDLCVSESKGAQRAADI